MSTLADAVRLDFPANDLFGRSKEVKALRDVLRRTCDPDGSSELVLVTGASGTGKTSLVRVALENVIRKECKGFFVSGKFTKSLLADSKDAYSALLQAMGHLCLQIDDRVEDRDELIELITKALGDEAWRVTSRVPELKTTLSHLGGNTTPSLHEMELLESTERFVTLFRTLILSVASVDHPIVMFIDDIQWSDADSLKLLVSLLSNQEAAGFLLVCTSRDDEVDESHPVRSILESETQDMDVDTTTVPVANLDMDTVNELIAFMVGMRVEETKELSELTHQKTLGNPFFVRQFLEHLQDLGLLKMSFSTMKWEWDINLVQGKTNISDNVVDLVIRRIETLSSDCQQVLNVLVCLGHSVQVDALYTVMAGVYGSSQTDSDFQELTAVAIKKLKETRMIEEGAVGWLKFSHDRCQQAVESWTHQEDKTQLHLDMGRILRSVEADANDWMLFTSVSQLNRGEKLMENEDERQDVARLNYKAAMKAKGRSAFLPAAEYCEAAIRLLGKDMWVNDHEFALDLYLTAAKCSSMGGRGDTSIGLLKVFIDHCPNPLARMEAEGIWVNVLLQQHRIEEGKQLALLSLEKFAGERFPRRPNDLHIIIGFLKTKRRLKSWTDEQLRDLPRMSDMKQITICKMMIHLVDLMFFSKDKTLMPLIYFRMVEIALEYGLCPENSMSFCNYAILFAHMNDIGSACRFAKLSQFHSQKYGNAFFTPRVGVVLHYILEPWYMPLYNTIDPLLEGYVCGMKNGNSTAALCNGGLYCEQYVSTGLSLEHAESDVQNFLKVTREYGLKPIEYSVLPLWQELLILLGDIQSNDPLELQGSAINSVQDWSRHLKDCGDTWALSTTVSHQIHLWFLFGAHERAVKGYKAYMAEKTYSRGHFLFVRINFYACLSAVSQFRDTKKRKSRRLACRIAKMFDAWVEKDGALNCVHMQQLIRAEILSIHNKGTPSNEIRKAYDTAINSARRSGFTQNAGIASERSALFHQSFDEDYYKSYLNDAYGFFVEWGAECKVDHLVRQHRCLRVIAKQRRSTASSTSSGRSSGGMRARRRFKESTVNQHQRITFI
jgi:histidine kinase